MIRLMEGWLASPGPGLSAALALHGSEDRAGRAVTMLT
jgi:hypothetical protein